MCLRYNNSISEGRESDFAIKDKTNIIPHSGQCETDRSQVPGRQASLKRNEVKRAKCFSPAVASP